MCSAAANPSPDADQAFPSAATAQMERLVLDLGRMYRQHNEALQEVASAHHEALLRLSRAAEFRDEDIGVHIVRMGFLAGALARQLGQPEAHASLLRTAAPMHDVGKIGIRDAVLKKPGKLSTEERVEMSQHSEMGAEILGRSRIPLFQLAAEVALTHHERWDGTGYPKRLQGDAIPLSGRIVAVVDFFDALTMDRCDRPAFIDEQALQMLVSQRGKAFDPWVVNTFVAHGAEMMALRDQVNRDQLGLMDLCGDAIQI